MYRPQFLFALVLAVAAFSSTAQATDVLTNRGDPARTGLNSNETILNPSSVSSPDFGLRYQHQVDGAVYAQPLYVSNQTITPAGGQPKVANVLYVATEHDSLYAFDADTGAQYWKISLLFSGETPVPASDVGCSAIQPEIGITATPVIDRTTPPNGKIFVLAFTKNGTNYIHRLHAIDLSTGQDRLSPRVISASTPPANRPANTFTPIKQLSRAGLLLLNSVVYTCWASYCDNAPYTGWIIGYKENDLTQAVILNTDPNGSPASGFLPDGSGNSIWQSGNAPAVDGGGNIYVATANGPFSPAKADYGDSVLKLLPGNLSVADYFTPSDQSNEAANDNDLGSAGPVLLPDIVAGGVHHHLLVQSGKDGNLYLLDRDNLGKFNSNNNSQIYQELPGVLSGGAFSSAAYFNGSIYYGSQGGPVSQFQFNSQGKLNSGATSSTSTIFGYPGATPTISSNGNSNGIVWAYENNSGQAVLHAYDATNLGTEIFTSGNLGGAVKFSVPTVCNGEVFVGTANSIAAFGINGPGRDWHIVGAADFNGDGHADLVWENRSNGLRAIWIMINNQFDHAISLGTVSTDWHIAGAGDFLGNGQSDLVWENTVTGQRAIWIMNSGVFDHAISLGTVSTDWHIVGAGDFNGDGHADLVWENSSNGLRAIWIMNNGQFHHAINLGAVSTDWHIAGVGDFLGNGQSDLVWENRVGGTRAIWIMNNGKFDHSINLGVVSNKWGISCAGDINGDGHADLIWENSSSVQRAIWLMNTNGTINQVVPIQ